MAVFKVFHLNLACCASMLLLSDKDGGPLRRCFWLIWLGPCFFQDTETVHSSQIKSTRVACLFQNTIICTQKSIKCLFNVRWQSSSWGNNCTGNRIPAFHLLQTQRDAGLERSRCWRLGVGGLYNHLLLKVNWFGITLDVTDPPQKPTNWVKEGTGSL